MKFAEHLSTHIAPEWRKQYINYEEMKAMLYTVVEEAPSIESVEMEVIRRHFASFDEVFFTYCGKELKKINTFFSEKLAESIRRYVALQTELKIIQNKQEDLRKGKGKVSRSRLFKKIREIKLAFSEYYLSLILVQNYQNLNYTGFRKILKKHDKLLNVETGSTWREEFVETAKFFTTKKIDDLIKDVESNVTDLEGGDRQRAMKKLRVPPIEEYQSPWTAFKVGLFSGSFLVLFTTLIISAFFHGSPSNLMIAFKLYRGPLLVILILFLIGINVYGWRKAGVNHVLIFELDPRNHLSEQHLMEFAAVLGVIWTLSFLCFLYSPSLGIPPYANPLALVVVMWTFLLNPFKIFRHEARFWLIKILVCLAFDLELGLQYPVPRIQCRVLVTPIFFINFADFWLGDQFISLVTPFVDFHFLICFYINNGSWTEVNVTTECTTGSLISRPIVNCLPFWFRMAQCVRRWKDSGEAYPHLANAGKYGSYFFVAITATLRTYYNGNYENKWNNPWVYLWILSMVIYSTYSYVWDIKVDWGLMDSNAGENKFLREEIIYPSINFYYYSMVEDFILRYIWIANFILTEFNFLGDELATSIFAPLEVFRRFVWNFFRVENEHLNNCGKFRAVRDISIAPVQSSDENKILRMMDEENGVTHHGIKQGDAYKQSNANNRDVAIEMFATR